MIMQVDLKRDNLPLIFIDANHHEVTFYESLFMRFANLTKANDIFTQSDPLFAGTFKVYAPVDRFDAIGTVLDSEATAMLAHHFRQFDYEIEADRLLVYASNTVITSHLLHEMLRVGSWLADHLEKIR
jgi:hypothetical protein